MKILNVTHRKEGVNGYGFKHVSKLVETSKGFYYVEDIWCGQGSIEGECYRPHIYKIDANKVSTLLEILSTGYGLKDADVAGITPLGRASKYIWAKKLVNA